MTEWSGNELSSTTCFFYLSHSIHSLADASSNGLKVILMQTCHSAFTYFFFFNFQPFLFNTLHVRHLAGSTKRKLSFKNVSNVVVQLLHSIKYSIDVPFANMSMSSAAPSVPTTNVEKQLPKKVSGKF